MVAVDVLTSLLMQPTQPNSAAQQMRPPARDRQHRPLPCETLHNVLALQTPLCSPSQPASTSVQRLKSRSALTVLTGLLPSTLQGAASGRTGNRGGRVCNSWSAGEKAGRPANRDSRKGGVGLGGSGQSWHQGAVKAAAGSCSRAARGAATGLRRQPPELTVVAAQFSFRWRTSARQG